MYKYKEHVILNNLAVILWKSAKQWLRYDPLKRLKEDDISVQKMEVEQSNDFRSHSV